MELAKNTKGIPNREPEHVGNQTMSGVSNPFDGQSQKSSADEKGILFSTNGLPGGMDDERVLTLVYTACRAVTGALGLTFTLIAFRTSFAADPSLAFDIVRSALSVAFMAFLFVSIAISQRVMFNRHKGHGTKFGMQLSVVTVRRTAAERFGRMIFWPVLIGTAIIICWLIFMYFELFPDKNKELLVWGEQQWSEIGNMSVSSTMVIVLMSCLVAVSMALLPTVSWLSLVTYEAHMKDPVERLSILLLEEHRLIRKGGRSPAAASLPVQQQAQRPELAQTRAARLIHRGRPPPRVLLDRHMRRVEGWLAASVHRRKTLRRLTQCIEWVILWHLYRIHRQLEARRLDDSELCTASGIIGSPGSILATILLITANVGYRICCEDQHHNEVPRIVLNVGRGVPGVKSGAAYIKKKSAASLGEIILSEARWARRVAFSPYVAFVIWSMGILYVWLPWTICYAHIHNFELEYLWETAGTVGMLVPLVVINLTTSVYNFLVYHRLLLMGYCVEQRGELEDARLQAEEKQVRRELLGKTFSAWKDMF